MSAETLRKAAEMLRMQAQRAQRGPWEAVEGASGGWWVERQNTFDVCFDLIQDDAEYIATMHPGVGLALADLLDHLADEYPTEPCSAPEGCNHCADPHWSLVSSVELARLIHGGTS